MPIIKQVAGILGWVMDLLYKMFSRFGIYNIGLCIIIFTIIVKLLILPMTIKQQKFTKLSSVMNPEIQAVQKKYSGKNDQESMMKMNQELQGIYEKYGTSPTSGCLTMLIQMPILFALYGVISQIPTFIPAIGDQFDNAAEIVAEYSDEFNDFVDLDKIINGKDSKNYKDFTEKYKTIDFLGDSKDKTEDTISNCFKSIASSPAEIWEKIFSGYESADETIEVLANYTEEDWKKLIENNSDSEELINKYEKYTEAEWTSLKSELEDDKEELEKIKNEVEESYDFIGVDLSKSPSKIGGIYALLIPVLAALSQLLSIKISNKMNNSAQQMKDNPMASSMNAMTYTMPIMSAFFCYTLASGLGLYWIIGALIQSVQSIFIARYFVKTDVNDIIKDNIEKANKKREKRGLPPKKITSVATTNVKNMGNEYVDNKSSKTNNVNNSSKNKKGSIASKANLVEKYNKK